MDLADWQPFGGHHVDWGNLATWFGALLTGLSLLLAFYIILRDRRRADRSQADQIACIMIGSATTAPNGQQQTIQALKVENNSPMHIMNPAFHAIPRRDAPRGIRYEVDHLPMSREPFSRRVQAANIWQLPSGDGHTYEIDVGPNDDHYRYEFQFMDARSRRWRVLMPQTELRPIKTPWRIRLSNRLRRDE